MTQNNACKKSLLVLAFSFFAVTGAFAQWSLGPELSLPMGDFGDAFDMGFGGSVNFQKPINDNLSWTAYGGIQVFSAKSTVSSDFVYLNMPIMAGVKYYFQESGKGLYGEVDLGLNFQSFASGGNSTSETEFGFTPAVGYRVSIFDIGARYNIVSDGNNLSFRFGFVFGGGK